MSLASGASPPDPHWGSPLDPAGGLSSPRLPIPHPLYENPGSATGQHYILM